jgi:type II secretory pathway pseudopilin PulG
MSRVRSQAGFALLDVLVAGFVLAIALAGLAGILIGSEGEASAEVTQSQLINVADQQIEQVRAAVAANGFNALALTAAPTPYTTWSTEQTWADPAEFVQTDSSCGYGYAFEILQNYDVSSSSAPPGFTTWSGCGTAGEPLQILSGGLIAVPNGTSPPACSSTVIDNACIETLSHGESVQVDTFVTDSYIGCGTNTEAVTTISCPNATTGSVANCAANSTTTPTFPTSTSSSTSCADVRRVVVAVVPPNTAGAKTSPTTPLYVSTMFTDPDPAAVEQGAIGIGIGAAP